MSGVMRIIVLLLLVTVSACTSGLLNSTATNDEDQDIGLGGTGLMANTGNGLGGTGIVGEITGFGSIFVNGVEIEYDSDTPFTINGIPSSNEKLAKGDVVEILTSDAELHTSAISINLRHEVIGKVESVDLENSRFTVLGQTIVLPAADLVLPASGATVAVSGFRINDRMIQATRVSQMESSQTLLHRHSELPFTNKVSRWLIQTYTSDNTARIRIDQKTNNISLDNMSGNGVSGNRILEIHQSEAGSIELENVIDPVDVPRGRQTRAPAKLPGTTLQQRQSPMHINMPQQHRMIR